MTALAVVLLLILVIGAVRRVNLYDAFTAGAMEGLKTAARIAPALIAMLVLLAALRASGLTAALAGLISPPFELLGVPKATLPVLLIRPFSGSGALAALRGVFAACGADSRAGMIASVMIGSSETVFYTCAVYLGAAGVKKSRHTVPAALLAWLAGGIVSCLLFPVAP